MFNDRVKLKGHLDIVLTNSQGEVKDHLSVPNLVVTTGRNYIASRMASNASPLMSHMAIGSGTTTPVIADTTLESQLARVTLTSTLASANVVTYQANFPAGTGTGAITEAGIFNDATTGDMLCRTTFAVVNKASDDSLSITWTVSNTSS